MNKKMFIKAETERRMVRALWIFDRQASSQNMGKYLDLIEMELEWLRNKMTPEMS